MPTLNLAQFGFLHRLAVMSYLSMVLGGRAVAGNQHRVLDAIERQISSRRQRSNAKPQHQTLSSDLANKPHAQLDEREPIALRLGEVCKLLV